jgi:glycerol-3-phosphate acyltransferase PlsX
MRIAVDAMGGDYAPAEIVKGAVGAAALYDIDVILVGDEEAIKAHLPKHSETSRISIHHTPDCISMDDCVNSVRTKPNASVVVAAAKVRSGEADAMISVGNTAAAMAVATLKLGRIPGIERPAIAMTLPSKCGMTVVLDGGATADCSPENLVQFAIMGSIYAEKVLKRPKPRVGLLSIGEEPTKGNELTKSTYPILENLDILNFVGNVEGRDIFSGEADVVVADGFVGNVALKVSEGIADLILSQFKELGKKPLLRIPLLMLKPALMKLKGRFDYTQYGGAPLLGVNGICIIGHGRSNAKAVTNAIRAAKDAVDHDIINCIITSLPSLEKTQALSK